MFDVERESFVVEWSGVSDGFSLTCSRCQSVLCDVEHGDTLRVLMSVADSHLCGGE